MQNAIWNIGSVSIRYSQQERIKERIAKEMIEETKETFKLERATIRMVPDGFIASDRPITTPEAAIQLVADELVQYDRETVCVINLKENLAPINYNVVSIGVLNQAIIHPRELLKSVILSNAACLIVVHNHPSGKLDPSEQDITTTDRLLKVCEMIGVRLMDHIIVAPNSTAFYSLHDTNKIAYGTELQLEANGTKLNWGFNLDKEGSNPFCG